MSLKKISQIRKGTVSLTIFRGEDDNKILVSFDKDFVSRRIKGPLFSETEMYDLIDIIRDYDETESTTFHGKAFHRICSPEPHKYQAPEKTQLTTIAETNTPQDNNQRKSPPKITVIPTMPKYRYLHTCPKCNCHTASYLNLSGSTALKLCSNCEHVYNEAKRMGW